MSSSNDYNWDADAVLKQIIKERGQTKVIFINGMNVKDINAHSNDVQNAFGLNQLQSQWDSLEFKNYENVSETNGGEAEKNSTILTKY